MDDLLSKDLSEIQPSDLDGYEDELEMQVAKLEKMKRLLDNSQEYRKNKQRIETEKRLVELDTQVEQERFARQELESMLTSLRDKEAQIALDEEALEKEIYELEKDQQIENIAILLLKAEEVRERKEKLEIEERLRNTEIEAISEETQRRLHEESHRLEKIFAKVKTLEDELQNPEYSKVIEELTEDLASKSKNSGGKFSSLKHQVASVRERQWLDKVSEFESHLAELCEERMKLKESEDAVAQRKLDHEMLRAKGLDFLVEMELGNTPPVELILRNLKMGDSQAKNRPMVTGSDFNVEEFLQNVELELEKGQTRIENISKDIQNMQKEHDRVSKDSILCEEYRIPYRGELGASSYDNPNSYRNMFNFTWDIVDEILDTDSYFSKELIKKQANEALAKWRASKLELERSQERTSTDNALRQVGGEIVLSALQSILHSLFDEILEAFALSSELMLRTLINAILSTRRGAIKEDVRTRMLKAILDLRQIRESYMNNTTKKLRDMPRITDIKLSRQVQDEDPYMKLSNARAIKISAWNFIKGMLEPKPADSNGTETTGSPSAESAEGGEDADQKIGASKTSNAITADVSHLETKLIQLGLVESMSHRKIDKAKGNKDIVVMERNFWNNMRFREKYFEVARGKYGTASSVAFSRNGTHLAVGTGLGALAIYNLCSNPDPMFEEPLMEFIAPPKGKWGAIKQIVWSHDAGSMIAAAYSDGPVRVFTTRTPPLKLSMLLQAKYKPKTLTPFLELIWSDFASSVARHDTTKSFKDAKYSKKEKKKIMKMQRDDDITNLSPSKIWFHSACKFSGEPTALMVALASGKIVKWNFDSANGETASYNPTFATSEMENPINAAFVPGKPRERGKLFGSTIQREFFVQHSHTPIWIGFTNHVSEMMWTLDTENKLNLWAYKPDSFTGFGWYGATEKYRLDTAELGYAADRSAKNEQTILFPPTDIKLPKMVDDDEENMKLLAAIPHFMDLQELQEETLAPLIKHCTPWMRKKLTNGRVMEIYAPSNRRTRNGNRPVDKHQVVVRLRNGALVQHMETRFLQETLNGTILDVCLTASGREIAFLVMYPAGAIHELKIFLYDTHELKINSPAIPITGISSVQNSPVSPRFVLGPFMNEMQTDYAYLLVNNVIYIISLLTGRSVMSGLDLVKKTKPGDVDVSLNRISVSSGNEFLVSIGANNDTVYLLAIDNENPSKVLNKENSSRSAYFPRECRL